MPLISKEADLRELNVPHSLFFALDRDMKIESVRGDTLGFAKQSRGRSAQIINDILSSSYAERFSSVADMALDVAHEVRNPLTIIGGYASARLRKIPRDDSSRDVLELISEQALRIEAVPDRFSSAVALGEKEEGEIPLENLIQETLGMLSGD